MCKQVSVPITNWVLPQNGTVFAASAQGFVCPERKGIAEFLLEMLSPADQLVSE